MQYSLLNDMQTMPKQYAGETKLQLNQRINLHRSDINTHKLERSPIAEHIHMTGHTFQIYHSAA